MKALRSRLEQAIENVGGVPHFAEISGLKRNTVYGWLKGPTEPRASDLIRISEFAKVDLGWLLSGTQEGSKGPVVSDDRVSIPRYEIRASAGDGLVPLSEDVADHMVFARDWISRHIPARAKLGMIESEGDSMEPTIRSGDGLIIRFDIETSDVDKGGIFVINLNGAVQVKRLQRTFEGNVLVLSDNTNYREQQLTPDQADQFLNVIAKVVFNIAPPRT